VYVPYVDSVHTFRTEVAIGSNGSPRQLYLGASLAQLTWTFIQMYALRLPGIAAVSGNCYPNYSTPDAESAS